MPETTATALLESLNEKGELCTPETGVISVPTDELVETILKLAGAVAEILLYDYQKDFARRVIQSILLRDAAMITAEFSRQSGKTSTVACVVVACAIILPELAKQFPKDWRFNLTDEEGRYRGYKHGVNFGIYAPILDQAQTTFERVRMYAGTPTAMSVLDDLNLKATVNRGDCLALTNGSIIMAKSASKGSNIEGKTHHVLILEEAQDIDTMKVRKCFAADTRMLTDGGRYATIQEVVTQQLPVVSSEALHQHVDHHDNGVQDVWEIETDEGRKLRTTSNHLHPVRWKGMKLAYVRKPLWELEVGWQLAVPDATPYFGIEGNYSEGLVLGLLAGDGCVTGDKPAFITDPRMFDELDTHLARWECTAKAYNVCSSGMIECGFTKKNGGNEKNSNLLTQWLKSIGFWGLKGANKHIPNLGWSKDFLRGLVEGLIITDGSVECATTKPVVSFANTSEELVDYLQDTLLKFGIHAAKHAGFFKGGGLPGQRGAAGAYMYRLHIKGVEDIRRFADVFDLRYKQPALLTAVQTVAGKDSRSRGQFYPPSMRFTRIRSIRYVGLDATYCVTVPTQEHLVVANGCLSSNSLHPMVAATKGTIIKIGTASIRKCDFYLAIQQNKRREAVSGRRDHFRYDYETCQRSNSLYRDYVKEEKNRLGEQSDEFRMAYKLEWILERGMFLTVNMLMNRNVARTEGPFSRLYVNGYRGTHLVAGIDLGKESDSTVVTVGEADWDAPALCEVVNRDMMDTEFVAYNKHVLAWMELQGDDYEYQYGEVVNFLRRFKGLQKVVLDATREASFHDRLSHQPGFEDVEFEDFVFSTATKAAGYRLLQGDILAGRLTFPAGVEARVSPEYRRFVTQMLDLTKTYQGEFLCVAAPDEKGAHDDYGSSVMLFNWGANIPAKILQVTSFSGSMLV